MLANQEKENTNFSKNTENNFHKNERLKNNIELLRQFKQGNFKQLKGYNGFGGLRTLVKGEKTQNELAGFLPQDEIERLNKSARTGYFTPDFLIDFIYALVQKLGFTHGKILEPACGHGAFFERMPEGIRQNSEIIGIELEPLCAGIAKALYPGIQILNQGFQHFHENNFGLVIGNPPYAPFSVYDEKHPGLKEEMIHHYFVAKSARLLKEGGLLAMVVPCYVLDNPKRHLREQISEVAELITAYRLPENLFLNASVSVDVVVFRRAENPNKDWAEANWTELPNKKRACLSQYFINHPENIIGELDTYKAFSFFEERPRTGLKCVAPIETVKKRLDEIINAFPPSKPS